jgi:pyruvate carboxylase
MGAAGTDVNKEIARCQALIKAAREEGIMVIGAHVEGMARRTDQSDQASIDGIVPLSDVVLATVDSDSDGYFSKLAENKGLPILVVKDALGIGSGLAEIKK